LTEEKKMIFVKWFPDDILNGCSLLTWQSELVYYRLINYIYTSDNNLFDDDVTWQVLTSKFNGNYSAIKDELIKKKKIYIQDGKIKNKGCDKWLLEAKTNFEINSERGKRGAEARWNKKNAPSNAQAIATINHKPLTINYNKNIYSKNFKIFWDEIVNKVSKGDGAKHFSRLEEEWQNQPEKLAQLYNNYYLAQDDKKFAKQPAYWLSARKYEDQKYEPKVYSREDEIKDKAKMFIDAIKENKITDFTKIWAKKNKGDVDNALKHGFIKQEDYNLLMHD
tara:strand:- start:416 stop:1252 length:837 start_codon:yes stop_codon:yes gene_type:complete